MRCEHFSIRHSGLCGNSGDTCQARPCHRSLLPSHSSEVQLQYFKKSAPCASSGGEATALRASIATSGTARRAFGHLVSLATIRISRTANHLATIDGNALLFLEILFDADQAFAVMVKSPKKIPCCVCWERLDPDTQDVRFCSTCGGAICCPGCGWQVLTGSGYRFECFHCADCDHPAGRTVSAHDAGSPSDITVDTDVADHLRVACDQRLQ